MSVTESEQIERGVLNCRQCGKPHDYHPNSNPKRAGSWASLDDRHAYYPESWETVARRLSEASGLPLTYTGEEQS